MKRRHCLAALTLAAALVPAAASAQAAAPYPSRAVTVVVGFPAGSATDVATRAVAEVLGRTMGQPFVVENRPGASSNIAARAVTGAPADGHTVFVGTIANTINATLLEGAVRLDKDLLPVAQIGSVPNLLVAHPGVGVKTVDELIRVAKEKPGQIAYASSGNGTSPHLSGELFASMAGVRMLHVPYKGSTPAVTDLLGGQVQVMFSPASSVIQHIRSGRLQGLASTGLTRAAIAPELPTIHELGLKGFETAVWFGFVVPPGTPQDVVTRLSAATQAALDDAAVQERFRSLGIEAVKAGPADFTRYIASETAKWAKVIEAAGLKP